VMITNSTTGQTYFQDPTVPARRGRNEWEANRRWRQVLEMELSAGQGCSLEEARPQVRSQRPWLYEETDRAIAAALPVPLTREQNIIQAYSDMGCSPREASERGIKRVQEDDKALFEVHGCTNYSTAKETVWLLEAASMLCGGDLFNDEALKLIDKARLSLSKK
jgi:hypothetical protein